MTMGVKRPGIGEPGWDEAARAVEPEPTVRELLEGVMSQIDELRMDKAKALDEQMRARDRQEKVEAMLGELRAQMYDLMCQFDDGELFDLHRNRISGDVPLSKVAKF